MSEGKNISHTRLKMDVIDCLSEYRRAGRQTIRAIENMANSWGTSFKWLYRLYSGDTVAVTGEQQRRMATSAIASLHRIAEQHGEDAQRCIWKADQIRKRELPEDDKALRIEAARILNRQAAEAEAQAKRFSQQAFDLLNPYIPGLFGETRQWSGPLKRRSIS